jgi:hypothetical protein
MARYHYYIGWDVSQDKLNYCLRELSGLIAYSGVTDPLIPVH